MNTLPGVLVVEVVRHYDSAQACGPFPSSRCSSDGVAIPVLANDGPSGTPADAASAIATAALRMLSTARRIP